MNEYKLSMYNLYLELDPNTLIIGNYLYDQFLVLDQKENIEEFFKIKNSLGKGELVSCFKSRLFTALNNRQFIIDQCIDEWELAKNYQQKEKYSEDRLELTIIPTQNCNFACPYCYQSHVPSKMSDQVAKGIYKYIENNISRFNSLYINWFGGEPLLEYARITTTMREIINICKENKKPVLAGITTNGYLLTQERMRELLNCKVYDYQVTLDGDAAHHNKQRPLKDGTGSYDIIVSNLKSIMQIQRRYNLVIRINISTLNCANLDDYAKAISDIVNGDPRITVLWHRVMDYGGKSILENKSLIHDDANISTKAMSIGIEYGVKPYAEALDKKKYMCEACKKNSYILNYDGYIYKCSNMVDRADSASDSSIGYICDGQFVIDAAKEERWISHEVKSKKCRECPIFPVCGHAVCPKRLEFSAESCLYDVDVVYEILKEDYREGKYPVFTELINNRT